MIEKNKENILISIILCVYNGELYIRDAINSICEQTYKNIELIVCDDGSQDDTVAIVKLLAEEDERIKLLTKENTGLTKSLNYALKMSNGDWIARQDADDISMRDRLEKQLNFCLNHKLEFATTYSERFDDKGTIDIIPKAPSTLAFDIELLKFGNFHTHGSFFIKRNVLLNYMYDENYRYAQDYNLLMRLLIGGVKCGILQETLYRLRIHRNSISNKNANLQSESVLKTLSSLNILTKYYLGQYTGARRIYYSILRRLYMTKSE